MFYLNKIGMSSLKQYLKEFSPDDSRKLSIRQKKPSVQAKFRSVADEPNEPATTRKLRKVTVEGLGPLGLKGIFTPQHKTRGWEAARDKTINPWREFGFHGVGPHAKGKYRPGGHGLEKGGKSKPEAKPGRQPGPEHAPPPEWTPIRRGPGNKEEDDAQRDREAAKRIVANNELPRNLTPLKEKLGRELSN